MNKKCTIRDVAALAGVSVGTVSMVLNNSGKFTDETRSRVMDAVTKLEYRRNPHAISLVSQKSRRIGLVVTDLTNPFFGSLVNHVQSAINARGYDLILGMTNNENDSERKVVSHFIDSAVDGVIIVPAHDRKQDLSHIYELARNGIPYVFLTSYYATACGDCVMTDLAKGSYELANYLIGMGHRKLTMVSGYREMILSSERIKGFVAACEEHGINVGAEQIVQTEPDFAGGREALDRILLSGKPDAILTVNDIVAMGIMKRAEEKNLRVPADLSVAGYDDLLFSSMLEKPLTTVRQPIGKICSGAVECLFERFENPDAPPRVIKYAPELCIRLSTEKQRVN